MPYNSLKNVEHIIYALDIRKVHDIFIFWSFKSSLTKFIMSLILVFCFIFELLISWISKKLSMWPDTLYIRLPLYLFFLVQVLINMLPIRDGLSFFANLLGSINYACLKSVRVHGIYKITDVYVIFTSRRLKLK